MGSTVSAPKDYGDGLTWWNLVFGAGYPDWLITSSLPPGAPGERWVWTGRALIPLPADLYKVWWHAHFTPFSLQDLRHAVRAHVTGTADRTALDHVLFDSGLFVTWPWGLASASDTPEAIGLRRNLVAQPPLTNPLPHVIPDNAWDEDTLSMDRLADWWAAARARGDFPGGLFDAVQDLVRDKLAWFVALPLS